MNDPVTLDRVRFVRELIKRGDGTIKHFALSQTPGERAALGEVAQAMGLPEYANMILNPVT